MAAANNKGSQPPMNRGDVIDDVAAQVDLPKSKVDEVLKAFEGALSRPLLSGREVRIAGFGTFKVRERSARAGRNPKTGEAMEIGASRNISFKPSTAFRSAATGGNNQSGNGTSGTKSGAKSGAAKTSTKGAAASGSTKSASAKSAPAKASSGKGAGTKASAGAAAKDAPTKGASAKSSSNKSSAAKGASSKGGKKK
jgi:DNA-binding protein HU-beta